MQLMKLSFCCLSETKEARKRREICTRSYLKNFLNYIEGKRSSRNHGKENNEKLDCRRKKLFSSIFAYPVTKFMLILERKTLKKSASKEVFEAVLQTNVKLSDCGSSAHPQLFDFFFKKN